MGATQAQQVVSLGKGVLLQMYSRLKLQLELTELNSGLVKLAIVVEGDPKAPLSIATTPRCKEVRYSIPWIAPLYHWSLPYSTEW